MLRIDHLEVHGLKPVSFSLQDGECIALMGPSGSGKSLLLRGIADLDPATGHIFLDGAERAEMTGPAWRRSVRYVGSDPGWWADTVGDHFPKTTAGRAMEPSPSSTSLATASVASDRLERLLDSFGLTTDILSAAISRTSTGERQRLALARALLDEPKVLLLDEPTAALDPTSTALVEEVVRYQLLLSRSVVIATHDLAQAQRIARKLIRLEHGAAHFYEFSQSTQPTRDIFPGAAA